MDLNFERLESALEIQCFQISRVVYISKSKGTSPQGATKIQRCSGQKSQRCSGLDASGSAARPETRKKPDISEPAVLRPAMIDENDADDDCGDDDDDDVDDEW